MRFEQHIRLVICMVRACEARLSLTAACTRALVLRKACVDYQIPPLFGKRRNLLRKIANYSPASRNFAFGTVILTRGIAILKGGISIGSVLI